LIFAGYNTKFALFQQAAEHSRFEKLKALFGVSSVTDFKERFEKGYKALNVEQWADFRFHAAVSFHNCANFNNLDTIS
jgi:hypothetical protein